MRLLSNLFFVVITLFCMVICINLSWAKALTIDPSGPWQKQKVLTIQGQTIRMPTYLPYEWMGQKLYWTATIDTLGEYKFYFGLQKNCNGENYCGFGVFYSYKLTDSTEGLIQGLLDEVAEEVEITPIVTGYYKLGKCYAYCNPTELYWIQNKRLYVVGSVVSHGEKDDVVELKKSALSLINNTLTKKTK